MTNLEIKAEVHRIALDFCAQLQKGMRKRQMTQAHLAFHLNITESAVSQFFRGENFTLENAIRYARAVGMKIGIVTYADEANVPADAFIEAWNKAGKPTNFLEL